MQTITTEEIISLYKKCDVSVDKSKYIRNTINLGTLNNKLNIGTNFVRTSNNFI